MRQRRLPTLSQGSAPTARGAERDSNGVGRGLIDAEWVGRDDGGALLLNMRSVLASGFVSLGAIIWIGNPALKLSSKCKMLMEPGAGF